MTVGVLSRVSERLQNPPLDLDPQLRRLTGLQSSGESSAVPPSTDESSRCRTGLGEGGSSYNTTRCENGLGRTCQNELGTNVEKEHRML